MMPLLLTLAFAASPTKVPAPPAPMRWEQKCEAYSAFAMWRDKISERGLEGWELVSAFVTSEVKATTERYGGGQAVASPIAEVYYYACFKRALAAGDTDRAKP